MKINGSNDDKDFAILMENNNASFAREWYFIERVVYNPDKTTRINYRVKENTQTIYNQKSCG
jgi:hypothetical protein